MTAEERKQTVQAIAETRSPARKTRVDRRNEEGAVFAAVGEAATGLALLIVPSLVGQLLLGAELTGVAMPVARVAGIALIALGVACWPGTPLARHVDLQRGRHAVSRLRRLRGRFDRHPAVAGGRPARDPDGTLDSGINKRQGDENIEE